jgi:hypothetical protein
MGAVSRIISEVEADYEQFRKQGTDEPRKIKRLAVAEKQLNFGGIGCEIHDARHRSVPTMWFASHEDRLDQR